MKLKHYLAGLTAALTLSAAPQNANAQNDRVTQNQTEQSAKPQFDVKKALKQFIGKDVKASEYWINGTNGDRYAAYSTVRGAFIGDLAGNGWFVESKGNVFYADEGKKGESVSSEEDKAFVNSLYASTRESGANNEKIGGHPIRKTGDLTLFVMSGGEDANGNPIKVGFVTEKVGKDGKAEHLYAPSEGEGYQFDINEQIVALEKIIGDWRNGFEKDNFALSQAEGGLTADERGFTESQLLADSVEPKPVVLETRHYDNDADVVAQYHAKLFDNFSNEK